MFPKTELFGANRLKCKLNKKYRDGVKYLRHLSIIL